MSALGDYVHLYYTNYMNYGTAKRGQPPKFANYNISAIHNRINNIEKIEDRSAISELERRLKDNTDEKYSSEQKKWANRQQQLLDQIYTILANRSRNVTGVQRLINISLGDYYKTVKGEARHIQHSGHWMSSLSLAELKERRQKARTYYSKANALIKKINSRKNKPTSLKELEQLQQLYAQYTGLSGDTHNHTVAEIETAIGEHTYGGASREVGGAFGEMFVAACDDRCFKDANLAVAQIVEQAVVGAERASIQIDKDLIRHGDLFWNTSTEDKTKYSLGSTQNKVDVQISINDEKLFASVKSYANESINSATSHLQDVNLLSTLTFLNNYGGLEDIGNHWLNLHCSHMGYQLNSMNSSGIDDIVKFEVAYQALSSGNPFKQGVDSANVFVFINRATGRVFVKYIPEVLKDLSAFLGLNRISTARLVNNRAESGAGDRIDNILSQVHGITLGVSLKIHF